MLDREDGPTLMGFYTTRFVRASNKHEAEFKCLKKLKNKDEYGSKHTEDSDIKPRVLFVEIKKARNQFSFKAGKGNVFFQMSDANEDGDHQVALEIELEANQNK